MNKDLLQGQWHQMKGKLKEKFGKLTNDDLTEINGVYETLEGKLQELYGFQKEEAAKEIKKFVELYGIKDKEISRS